MYTNILISFAAALLVFISFKEFSFNSYLEYTLFIFGSTLFTYNIQRLIKFRKRKYSSFDARARVLYKKLSIYFSTIGGGISIYFVFKIPFPVVLTLTLMGFLSLTYILPFSITKKISGLREVPFLKIYLIAFIWTITTAYIPVSHFSDAGLTSSMLFCFERFLFILAITIPFDIRDLRYDPPNFKTIPQVFGVNKSKILAIAFLIICILIVSLQTFDLNVSLVYFTAAASAYIIASIFIWNSRETQNNLYFSGAIDGTMVFFGTVYILLSLFV